MLRVVIDKASKETGEMEQTAVVMSQLRAGDLWLTHGGWHRVVEVDHQVASQRGTRSLAVVQAITAHDGRHTYGRREWSIGLRTDLAEVEPCIVRREVQA